MGMVIKQLSLRGNKGAAKVHALFDTGASKSLIRRNIAARIGTIVSGRTPWRFILGDGRKTITTKEMVSGVFTLKGVSVPHTFIVAPRLFEDLVIGTDIMQFWKIRPDPAKEDLVVDKKLIQLKLV